MSTTDGLEKQASGAWDQLVGQVKSTYGDVTDDDIAKANGDKQQLMGIIKQRTGEAEEAISAKINELTQ